MTTQPEALRLADALDAYCTPQDVSEQAAAELRRLHELALEQQGKIYALEMARSMEQKTAKLKHDALLEALKEIDSWLVCSCIATAEDMAQSFPHMQQVASAAIEAVEETK